MAPCVERLAEQTGKHGHVRETCPQGGTEIGGKASLHQKSLLPLTLTGEQLFAQKNRYSEGYV